MQVKKTAKNEPRCLKYCEQLRSNFLKLRAEYQHEHGRAYYDYRAGIEKSIKRNPKSFLSLSLVAILWTRVIF
jgi:hypothetical protein